MGWPSSPTLTYIQLTPLFSLVITLYIGSIHIPTCNPQNLVMHGFGFGLILSWSLSHFNLYYNVIMSSLYMGHDQNRPASSELHFWATQGMSQCFSQETNLPLRIFFNKIPQDFHQIMYLGTVQIISNFPLWKSTRPISSPVSPWVNLTKFLECSNLDTC